MSQGIWGDDGLRRLPRRRRVATPRTVGTSVHEAVTSLAEADDVDEGLVDRIQVVAAQIPLPAAMPSRSRRLPTGPAQRRPHSASGCGLSG